MPDRVQIDVAEDAGDTPSSGEEVLPVRDAEPLTLGARLRAASMSPWPYFGGLALACLGIQVVTGLLMAFRYQPTPDEAYVSVYYIANVMPYGWLVRSAHSWGSVLTLVFAALHAVSVFIKASYKKPRQGNWVLGVLALMTAVALGFTGRLLPWDQMAYWGTEAAVDLFRQAPLVGDWIARGLLGGELVGAATLTRFYAAHVTVLPATLLALLLAHLFLARKQDAADELAGGSRIRGRVPLYPDILLPAATTLVLLLAVFLALASLVPATLDVKADLTVAPQVAKPTWNLLSMYALSQYLNGGVAASVTAVLGLLFLLLPYIDRGPTVKPRERRFALLIGLLVIGGVCFLTLAGALL